MTILEAIFGCWHRRTTFPITQRAGQRRTGNPQRGTYVVCLDCGKEFAYDWQKMRVIPASRSDESYAAARVEAKAS